VGCRVGIEYKRDTCFKPDTARVPHPPHPAARFGHRDLDCLDISSVVV